MLGTTVGRFLLLAIAIPLLWSCELFPAKEGRILQVQVELDELLLELSMNNPNKQFRATLAFAKETQRTLEHDFLTIFGETYAKDTSINIATFFSDHADLKSKINATSSNDEVLIALRLIAKELVGKSSIALKKRIDYLGIRNSKISVDWNQNLITMELPGYEDEEGINDFLLRTAKLEFWETWTNMDLQNQLIELNDSLKVPEVESENTDKTALGSIDVDDYEELGSLFRMLDVNFARSSHDKSATIGYALIENKDSVMAVLNGSIAQRIFGKDKPFIQFVWDVEVFKGIDGQGYTRFFALKRKGQKAELDGSFIKEAYSAENQYGSGFVTSATMNEEGTRIWEKMTTDNVGCQIAVSLDDLALIVPHVNEPIPSGVISVRRGFDTALEADAFGDLLVAGALPCSLTLIDMKKTGIEKKE